MPKFEAGMEGMLDAFLFETGELLETLDDILMRCEQEESIDDISDDDINEIFRTMHTIKGSAAMMGLQNMSTLAHAVEDLFYIIRERSYVNMDKPKLFELLFKASDDLKGELDNLNDEDIPLTDFTDEIGEIHALAASFKGEGGTAAKAEDKAGSGVPDGLFRDDDPEDMLTFKVIYADSCAMPSARAMVLLRKLGAIAEVCRTIPEDLDQDSADDVIKAGGLYLKVMTDDKDGVLKMLSGGMNVQSAEAVEKSPQKAPEKPKAAPAPTVSDDGRSVFKVVYSDTCAMPSARALVLLRKLGAKAEEISTEPADLDDDGADDVIMKNGLIIRAKTSNNDEVLELLKGGMNVQSAELIGKPQEKKADTKAQEKAKAAPKKQAAKKAPAKQEQSMLTVKLEKLNRLLDLVSEIVITEGMVTASPDLRKFSGELDRFNKSARELKKLTDELQDVVMSIRMVPVSTAFQKMNRVVRDMNNSLHKNVELVFEGQETEVDKSIIDILGDPLMHIVRNAVDHGIEPPEERAASGKTEPPTVTLSAGYDSSEVVISCTDNGAGMDAAKIMAKAKKNGLLTKPESEYTEKEIFSFVMAAGFSTNEVITEYSGRGVGMDVVKKNLEKVGGKLLVDSVFGKGSTFQIRIPLSLSIVDVLSVAVGSSSLSVPASSVLELFSCSKDSFIVDPEGNEFVYLRGECLPLIRLSQIMKLPTEVTEPEKGICINCKEGGHNAVLFADRIICDQQVVVKPFSPLLDDLKLKEAGLAGCSILGDGSMTMILDIKEILAADKKKQGGARTDG